MNPVQQALHDVLREHPMKVAGIAARMGDGVSASVLYGWANGSKAIPLSRLIQFVLITGDHRPIAALCEELGGAFLPLPSRGPLTDKAATRALKEFSDLMQEGSRAALDGRWTGAELARVEKEAAEAQRAIAQYVAWARDQAYGGRQP